MPTTTRSRSRKTTSIGNRMKQVWIADVGRISKPSSARSPARPRRPLSRVSGVATTLHRSQTSVPPPRTTAVSNDLPMALTLTAGAAHHTVARSSRTSPPAGPDAATTDLSSLADGFGHWEVGGAPPSAGAEQLRGGEEGNAADVHRTADVGRNTSRPRGGPGARGVRADPGARRCCGDRIAGAARRGRRRQARRDHGRALNRASDLRAFIATRPPPPPRPVGAGAAATQRRRKSAPPGWNWEAPFNGRREGTNDQDQLAPRSHGRERANPRRVHAHPDVRRRRNDRHDRRRFPFGGRGGICRCLSTVPWPGGSFAGPAPTTGLRSWNSR